MHFNAKCIIVDDYNNYELLHFKKKTEEDNHNFVIWNIILVIYYVLLNFSITAVAVVL